MFAVHNNAFIVGGTGTYCPALLLLPLLSCLPQAPDPLLISTVYLPVSYHLSLILVLNALQLGFLLEEETRSSFCSHLFYLTWSRCTCIFLQMIQMCSAFWPSCTSCVRVTFSLSTPLSMGMWAASKI